jgi:hypothetical protein
LSTVGIAKVKRDSSADHQNAAKRVVFPTHTALRLKTTTASMDGPRERLQRLPKAKRQIRNSTAIVGRHQPTKKLKLQPRPAIAMTIGWASIHSAAETGTQLQHELAGP